MPVGGEIVEINESLEDSPELVNRDPFGKGWLVKVDVTDPAQLDDLLEAQNYRDSLRL